MVVQGIQNDNQSQKEVTNNVNTISYKSKLKNLVRPRGLIDFIVLKIWGQVGKQEKMETEGILYLFI